MREDARTRRTIAALVCAALHCGGPRADAAPPVRSLLEMRQKNVVMQQWDISCGAAALATLLRHHFGDPVTERDVARDMLRYTDARRVRTRGGFSLLDLKRYTRRRGLDAEGYAGLSLDDLRKLTPLIVPMRITSYDHFVVLRAIAGPYALIADPAFGNRTMPLEEFTDIWHGQLGFVVKGPALANGLRPRSDDFVSVDARAISAAISTPWAGAIGAQ
jgi:predicted double-glycine peptidase